MENVQRTKKTGFLGIAVALILIGVLFFSLRKCAQAVSPDSAYLALKKNGETFVFSTESAASLQSQLDLKLNPSYFPTILIYKDEKYFVQPENCTALAQVMSKKLSYFNYKQPNFEGYITADSVSIFSSKNQVSQGKTIGEQITTYHIELKNNHKTLHIIYRYNSRTMEYTAVKNCEVHTFSVGTNNDRGGIDRLDYVVIPIDRLAEFYHCSYNYDEDNKVLYVK